MGKSGKLIIFNMEVFQQEAVHNLPGNRNDVRILQETFAKYNADVECVFTNYTLQKIKTVMQRFQRENLSSYKYFIVAILTHGDRKEVLLSCDEVFDLDNEIIFPILRNSSLKNTPKLFIIDACKGKYDLIEAEPNAIAFTDDDLNTSDPYHGVCPRRIMRCFATSEGFKAFGTEAYGSYFVQVFCTKLKEKGSFVNVKKIMEECISAVEKKSQGRQIPTISHNMNEKEVEEFTLGRML